MKRKLRPLLAGALAVGALIAYDGLAHYVSTIPDAAPWAALITLAPVLGFALSLLLKHAGWPAAALGALAAGTLFSQIWPYLGDRLSILYLAQYLSTNLALGLYFGRSLGAGQTPACTAFARLLHPSPSPQVLRYTRRITIAWTLFFAGSAVLSTLLYVLAPIQAWSLFSNLLYLPSLVLMFVVEGLVRRVVLPPEERHGVIASLRAYHASTRPNAAGAASSDGQGQEMTPRISR
ncbi:hypothetical protein [Zoogloea sp.]|uniref:COG4648 family protein n=1 Tax=Zoogloea sp. TaxID=49181 RepID=UPI001415819C|nr:MAG: hypothetical protein F9K15_09515 [Zoogloea sp.]